jgi:tetratricopeptide (TPR) repeat protein
MDTALQEWLTCAPTPPPLANDQRWHVFISYRSVNRYWVLELYDILRQLGYSVFLDQYVLAAAAPLGLTLGEELDSSAAAVLVWSSSYEDSEWCRKEFNYLEGRENNRTGFRYVIGKLDSTTLPGFASGKIYIDFSDRREGPGGSDILRLLHGLAGRPLPEKAVRLANEVDEETKQMRVKIRAARETGDADRLLELAKSTHLAWLNSPALGCAVVEALIGLRKTEEAEILATGLCQRFPRTTRPKQLLGLACARKGDWKKAQEILGELYTAGEIDPETLGIYARTWMDRFKVTGDNRYLLKSRDLYRQAFDALPTNDYYTGINAASKSLLLGERETAAQLAERVEKIVGTQPVSNDYFKTATIAEVQLLRGNFDEAGELYQAAVVAAPEDVGSHGSTYVQAVLLLNALKATEEQKVKVLAPFAHVAKAATA